MQKKAREKEFSTESYKHFSEEGSGSPDLQQFVHSTSLLYTITDDNWKYISMTKSVHEESQNK